MAYDTTKVVEVLDSRTISFGQEGGSLSVQYEMGSDYLNTFLSDCLGFARPYSDGKSGINRNLPMGDGQFPTFLCDSVNPVGKTYVDAVDYETTNLGDFQRFDHQMFATYARYERYFVEVTFSPRPYFPYSNAMIQAQKRTVTYHAPAAELPTNFLDVHPEELRFTTIQILNKNDILQADVGSSVYYDTTVASPINGTNSTSSNTKINYPTSSIAIKWFCVPYEFILGFYSENEAISYRNVFEFALGKINQNTWMGFPPGTLLFEGINTTNIVPVPFPEAIPSTILEDTFVFNNAFTCDIEMTFSYRNPKPACSYTTVGNVVYNGHNLLPRTSSGKNYAVVVADSFDDVEMEPDITKENVLLYQSFAMELLFTSPAFTLPILFP